MNEVDERKEKDRLLMEFSDDELLDVLDLRDDIAQLIDEEIDWYTIDEIKDKIEEYKW